MSVDPRSFAPSATEFHFTSDDGLVIACTRWNASNARGIVQIAHGMGEHIGRYGETIRALVDAGLTVYGNDHRGHGRTALAQRTFGDFGAGGFPLLVDDMHRLAMMAREENAGLPFILLGHSMGSFAAQCLALDHSSDIDALALSGSGALDGIARLVASAAPGTNVLNASFEPAPTPFEWLSRDRAIVDRYVEDPLCFAALAPASFASFLGAADRLRDSRHFARIRDDLPVYVFSGSDDPVGERLAGVRTLIHRLRHAGVMNVAHDFYPDGRHEMLNEINRSEVRANLLRWIDTVIDGARTPPATTHRRTPA